MRLSGFFYVADPAPSFVIPFFSGAKSNYTFVQNVSPSGLVTSFSEYDVDLHPHVTGCSCPLIGKEFCPGDEAIYSIFVEPGHLIAGCRDVVINDLRAINLCQIPPFCRYELLSFMGSSRAIIAAAIDEAAQTFPETSWWKKSESTYLEKFRAPMSPGGVRLAQQDWDSLVDALNDNGFITGDDFALSGHALADYVIDIVSSKSEFIKYMLRRSGFTRAIYLHLFWDSRIGDAAVLCDRDRFPTTTDLEFRVVEWMLSAKDGLVSDKRGVFSDARTPPPSPQEMIDWFESTYIEYSDDVDIFEYGVPVMEDKPYVWDTFEILEIQFPEANPDDLQLAVKILAQKAFVWVLRDNQKEYQ